MSDEKPATPEAAPVKKPSREESKCSVEGCKRPYRAKTYCNVHYKEWRTGGMDGHHARYKTCTKEGCKKARAAFGSLCEEHGKAAAVAAAPAA